MKYSIYLLTVFFLLNCKEKEETIPDPDDGIHAPNANFAHVLGENGEIELTFPSNVGDYYFYDFGDGTINKNVIKTPQSSAGTLTLRKLYTDNGTYTISLTVANVKGVTSSSQTIVINNIPPTPIASFKYEKLPGGDIKVTNLSKNFENFEWRLNKKGSRIGYRSKNTDPTYKFENNGTYYFNLRVTNKYGLSRETLDSVIISQAPNINNPIFEGIFFGKSGIFTGEGANSFEESWNPIVLDNHSVYNASWNGVGGILFDMGKPISMSLENKRLFLKQRLQPGIIKKDSWRILISETVPASSGSYFMQNYPKAVFEILAMEEVDQPELFPEMYEKAIWVTIRIKADFGVKGIVDGKLKIRYLIF